jgi:hypothetical protein
MPEQSPDPLKICAGVRVKRQVPGHPSRIGLVVADPESKDLPSGHGFVEVLPEGSATSRPEPWPLRQVSPLPVAEQLPKFGGSFSPPKGYPLRTRS